MGQALEAAGLLVRWLYHAAEVGLYEFNSTYIAIGSLARIGGLRDTSRIVLGLTLKLERLHFFSRKSFCFISGLFLVFFRSSPGMIPEKAGSRPK